MKRLTLSLSPEACTVIEAGLRLKIAELAIVNREPGFEDDEEELARWKATCQDVLALLLHADVEFCVRVPSALLVDIHANEALEGSAS